jgi:hypothetical protein
MGRAATLKDISAYPIAITIIGSQGSCVSASVLDMVFVLMVRVFLTGDC